MDKIDKVLDIVNENKEIIKNIAEPASKEVGGILGTFTVFFNNVVLYPLKCLNMTFEQKAIQFERKVQEKYNNIPEQNRVECPVNILGPTLEGLKYNIDEEYMQELFANLLSASMDKYKQSSVHPKYVKIISEMNEIDARVFYYLTNKYIGYVKSGKVNITIKGTDQYYVSALPEWIIEDDIQGIDMFSVSKALIRLSNWGLLDLMYDRRAGQGVLNNLYQKQEVQNIFNAYLLRNSNIELKGTDCIININDEGKTFAKIVFGK